MKINSLFVLFNIFVEIQSLVELPTVEDNSIATAVIAIQNTVNNLFTSFNIKNVRHSLELNQFFTIHNLFVSITFRDCDSWKKIVSLSRVNDIDNKTIYFITQINEVLNEGVKYNSADDIDKNIYVDRCIDTLNGNLEYLKEWCVSKRREDLMNSEILNHFDRNVLKWEKSAKHNNTKTNDKWQDAIHKEDFWQPSGRRIYKGSRANIKDFPFMASVQFFGRFQCGGSIIKSDLVITAASCLQLAWNNRFFRENPAYLTVQIGSHFYEHGGESVSVQEVYFHPKYDPKILRHNLAVMRLSRKIAFQTKTKRVKKIDIDRNPSPLFAHDRITIVGWGARDRSNIIYNIVENRLSYAELDYFPFDECQEYYSEEYVTRKNFCAGFFSKGSGACNRDVGGPGVIDGTLMGVISFASPVCGAPGPTVFTKIGYYADWIDGIIAQEVPSILMATTLPPSRIYYKDINTETSTTIHFTPFGDTTAPWEEAVKFITKPQQLRTAANNNYQPSQLPPILGDETSRYYKPVVTAQFPPRITISGNNVQELRTVLKTRYTLPPTIISFSKQYVPVTTKIIKRKRRSTSTTEATTKNDKIKIGKRKKVKSTKIVGTQLELTEKTTTESLSNKIDKDDDIENDLMKVIDNLDIDRIVKSIGPELVSKLTMGVKVKKKNKKKRPVRKKTTKDSELLRKNFRQPYLL